MAGEDEPTAVVTCAECGHTADEPTAEKEKWGYWSDGLGELHLFCPECAEREFGHARG